MDDYSALRAAGKDDCGNFVTGSDAGTRRIQRLRCNPLLLHSVLALISSAKLNARQRTQNPVEPRRSRAQLCGRQRRTDIGRILVDPGLRGERHGLR
jgi:hypothetical protein